MAPDVDVHDMHSRLRNRERPYASSELDTGQDLAGRQANALRQNKHNQLLDKTLQPG